MKNLDDLIEEYPEFFKVEERATGDGPKMPFVLFGFECGNGWYTIIATLIKWIKFNVENNDYPMIIVDQVKEKFGGLRFYYEFEPFDEHEWKSYRKKDTDEEKIEWLAKASQKIDGAIDLAESLAYRTCEVCGSTDEVTTEGPRWIVTKCKKCRDE